MFIGELLLFCIFEDFIPVIFLPLTPSFLLIYFGFKVCHRVDASVTYVHIYNKCFKYDAYCTANLRVRIYDDSSSKTARIILRLILQYTRFIYIYFDLAIILINTSTP